MMFLPVSTLPPDEARSIRTKLAIAGSAIIVTSIGSSRLHVERWGSSSHMKTTAASVPTQAVRASVRMRIATVIER